MKLSKALEQVHESLVFKTNVSSEVVKAYEQVHEGLVKQWGCQKHVSRFMRIWYSRGVAKSI